MITVCNSFYATAGAIHACGAKIIFVDCDERFQIDVNKNRKGNNKTKGLFCQFIGVVHLLRLKKY